MSETPGLPKEIEELVAAGSAVVVGETSIDATPDVHRGRPSSGKDDRGGLDVPKMIPLTEGRHVSEPTESEHTHTPELSRQPRHHSRYRELGERVISYLTRHSGEDAQD